MSGLCVVDAEARVLGELEECYDALSKPVTRNIALVVQALLRCGTCSTAAIAREMAAMTGQSFDTAEQRLSRFLQSSQFEVDERLQRRHIQTIFNILQEKGLQKKALIPISIDFTSQDDRFLILQSAIPWAGRALPLTFSLRRYPHASARFDQTAMEDAFLRALRHLLPKGYRYMIVADRGFGHGRFIRTCTALGFDYLVRVNDNLRLENAGDFSNLAQVRGRNFDLAGVEIPAWSLRSRVLVREKKVEGQVHRWCLMTSVLDETPEDLGAYYAGRFGIEKLFQDTKSAGFDIENSKIEKYDRFKRLYFLVTVAQALFLFIGDFINDNDCALKKNFRLHWGVLSAYALSPQKPINTPEM